MQSDSYRFTLVDGDSRLYAFTTSNLIDYEVRFISSGYLFEHVDVDASHEKVVVFVCDTSDQRQRARARKFSSWFNRGLSEVREDIGKIDRQVIASDSKQILMSLFIHLRHPHRSAIIDAFFAIGEEGK